MVRNGADVNVANWLKQTALMETTFRGNIEIVEMLISEDANVAGSEEWTALMFATRNGFKEIVEMLIVAGVNAEITNNKGKTTRDLYRGYVGVFDRLVEKAAGEKLVKAAY